MIFLLKGVLPWQNLQGVTDTEKSKVVGEIKVKTKSQVLCQDLPHQFVRYFDYIKKLTFKQDPDYEYLKSLFRKLAENEKYDINDGFFDWTASENMQARRDKD